MKSLKGKLFIEGQIELLTGMRIGGSSTSLDIGGVENNVIKTACGVPYIPGSSLKGKLRTLYALTKGYADIRGKNNSESAEKYDENDPNLTRVFGLGADDKDSLGERTRLIVRDAYLDKDKFSEKLFELENEFTETKWENTIERTTSKATPRQMERVPLGSYFNFQLVYSIFDSQDIENLNIIAQAMRLLQDDYLGGSGSRGYGRIKFHLHKPYLKTISHYESNNGQRTLVNILDLGSSNAELIKELKQKLELSQIDEGNNPS